MKIYSTLKCLFWAFLTLVSIGVCNASVAADAAQVSCQPYSIPLDPVACDAGYTGKKFPMKTKVCPSGVVTTGQTFNTDNCVSNGQHIEINATNCTLTPSAKGCAATPNLKGCESGWHWSLSGSAVAHCVPDDMVCPWGQSLTHNALGYPSCVQNTCPSNQVLQADGIACGCPSGLVWNGSSCVVPCIPSSNTQTGSCPAGYTGNATRIASFICPSQTTTFSPWDNSACNMTCPGTTAVAGACPVGYTGNIITTTKYSGPGCTATSSVDSSGCKPKVPLVCANGAANFPACILVPTCPDSMSLFLKYEAPLLTALAGLTDKDTCIAGQLYIPNGNNGNYAKAISLVYDNALNQGYICPYPSIHYNEQTGDEDAFLICLPKYK